MHEFYKTKYCFVFLLCPLFAISQNYNPEAVNKKASEIYTTALNLLQDGARREVIPVLQKAISLDAKFIIL